MSRIAVLYLLALLFSFAHGCSCLAKTFEERYSTANVVSARVLFSFTLPEPTSCPVDNPFCQSSFEPIAYLMIQQKVFRGCGPSRPPLFLATTQEFNGANCGQPTLERGETYLLFLGPEFLPDDVYRFRRFSLSICQGNIKESSLTAKQRNFLTTEASKPVNQCASS